MNTSRAFLSEWILLNRRRIWAGLVATTLAFTVVSVWLLIASASPSASRPTGRPAVDLEALTGPGGATAAVVASAGLGTILVIATFIAAMGNDITRGTLRVAMTHTPGRLSLITGKLVARIAVATTLMVLALASGAVTAAIVAPGRSVDTAGWFGADGLLDAGTDLARLLFFVGFYALVGTTLAVLVRSTPIAIGIGLLWFGPLENVIAGDREWAQRWFPGLVMRAVVDPAAPHVLSTGAAAAVLCGYGALCAAVIAISVTRRDVAR
ncbi:hypothetical protein [Tsukamurella sp. 1534]|uniref:hypothetical protein n=1 Tax=Tsukamurella sp. 1534 TaxID=1151061 RepID=UPI000302E3B2|nr:hypothetical protein [Tsukamurella sp. 1534]